MKRVKRLLAVFLTALMVMTSFPLTALAENIHPDAQGQTDDVSWRYYSDTDTLYINTINESGLLTVVYNQPDLADNRLPTFFCQEDYENGTNEWDSSFVSHIIIGKDVKSIENVYFGDWNYGKLETLSFENGSQLKMLGDEILNSCLIEHITLPNNLEYIGEWCFFNTLLKEIVIPDSVYHIGDYAFYGSYIEKITLPSYHGDEELYFGSAFVCDCSFLEEINFGEGITHIPDDAFNCCYPLKEIIIPDTVTHIGSYAFAGCEDLERIVMPASLEYIGEGCFHGDSNLVEIDFSKIKKHITLDGNVFGGDTKIKEIKFPVAPQKIGKYAFAGMSIENIDFGGTVAEIGEYAFADCTEITEYDFTNVKSLGDYAFKNTGITEVNFSSRLQEIGVGVFEGTGVTKLNLKDTNVTELPDNAFKDMTTLTEIILPENLYSIGEKALYNTGITELTIPASVAKTGQAFASNCHKLEWVDYSPVSAVSYISGYAFSYCETLIGVNYLENIKSFGVYAFYCCDQLQWIDTTYNDCLETIGRQAVSKCPELNEFTFPSSLKTIGDYAFSGSYLNNADLSKCNSLTTIGRGAFKNTKLNTFKFPAKKSIDVPEEMFDGSTLREVTFTGAETIGRYAFRGTQLKRVELPDNCQTLAMDSFANCPNLEYVRLSYAFAPSRLMYNPFTNSTNINTIIWPSRQSANIVSRLFTNDNFLMWDGLTVYCYDDAPIKKVLEEYNINYEILEEEIENNYNENSWLPITTKGTCDNGTWRLYTKSNYSGGYILEVNVDGPLTNDKIVCSNGKELTFKELALNVSITKIFFSEGITSICDDLFYVTGKGITSGFGYYVSFPSTLEKIGKNAFRNIWGMSKVIIPDNVTEIGEYAFANNPQTHNIQLGNGITELKEGVFYGANPVTCKLSENLVSVDKMALAGITTQGSTSKINFVLPETLEYIYTDPTHPENNAFGFNRLGVIDDRITFKVHYGTPAYQYVKQYCLKYVLLSGAETEEDLSFVPEHNYREVNWGYLSNENTIKNNGVDYFRTTWVYNEFDKTLTVTGMQSEGFNQIGNLGFFRADKTQVKQGDLDVDTIILTNINYIYSQNPEGSLSMFNPKEITINGLSCTKLDKGAFKNCTRLEALEIPDSVVTIDSTIFENCTSLKYVRFGSGVASIPANILKNSPSLEYLDIAEGCTSVGPSAFRGCNKLHEINIPDSVRSIGSYAFYKDLGVNKITLGKGVKTVNANAFNGIPFCTRLEINSDIFATINEGRANKNASFGYLGSSTTGTEVIFGDTEVANLLGFINANVTKLTFSEKVENVINTSALPQLKEIQVSKDNEKLHSFDNALYSEDTLLLAPRTAQLTTIENGITAIADYAFNGCKLKSVIIPNSVENIGKYAFAGCSELKSVKFGDKLEAIGDYAFCGCPLLRTLYLHENVKSIGAGAFENDTSLASILLDDKLETIGDNAFKGCSSLIGACMPYDLVSIGNGAFMDCENMEYAYIWYATLGTDVFKNDDKITLYTPAGSDTVRYARVNKTPLAAYADEDSFEYEWAVKLDSEAGYLGYCTYGHGDIEYLTVYKADCNNDGYIIGVCEYCSEILEEIHVPALNHNYVMTANIAPTASTKGITVYTCSNCGESLYTYENPTGEDYEIESHTVTGTVVAAQTLGCDTGVTAVNGASVSIDGEILATTDKNGNFSLTLDTGTYEATISYNYGFNRKIYIVVEDEDIDAGKIAIVGCDWNSDGKIDDGDMQIFQLVLSSRKNDLSYLEFVDLNKDGYINTKDAVILRRFMNTDSASFIYNELVINK